MTITQVKRGALSWTDVDFRELPVVSHFDMMDFRLFIQIAESNAFARVQNSRSYLLSRQRAHRESRSSNGDQAA